MKSKNFAIALGAAAALCVTQAASAAVIDTFDVGGFSVTGNGVPAVGNDTGLALTDVVGGERNLVIQNGPGSINGVSRAHLNTIAPGELTFQTGNNNRLFSTLSYGLSGDLDADLTVGGKDSIAIDFSFIENGKPMDITIFVRSDSAEAALNKTASMSNSTVYFDFADFIVVTPPASGSLDWTAVDEITFVFNSSFGGDYRLDLLESAINPNGTQAIPSPAAVSVGMLLAGFGLFRRRRSAQQKA